MPETGIVPAVSPILRLTVGLIMLTVSLLLVGDILGLTPDQNRAELQARKSIAEALAVQVSTSISNGRVAEVSQTMKVLQARNASVLSVGLRKGDGHLLSTAGDHIRRWQPPDDEKSSPAFVQVPIHGAEGRWGTLEVAFEPLADPWATMLQGGSIAAVVLFVALSGFVAYWLFLKRALKELDPSAVIPDRVRAALDVLAEGLVILDREERIVFVNAALERRVGLPAAKLVGSRLSTLQWQGTDDAAPNQPNDMPWKRLLEGGVVPETAEYRLVTELNESFLFAVNVAPIKAPDGELRGVVVTLDDVTEMARKNLDLERALDRLKDSQREITRQNRELHLLATRDPLTGALNRRSLFDGMGTLLDEAERDQRPLSCIMVDIDHFKSINDRFGHATGDKVIKLLANILTENARAEDLVGRYGGEEFCVILPGVDEASAAEVAERMRIAVHDGKSARFTSAIRISASFGVSCADGESLVPSALVDRADKALYVAKESGRNRVIRWSQKAELVAADEQAVPAVPAPPAPQAESTDPDREKADLQRRIDALEGLLNEFHEKAGTDDLTGLPGRIVLIDRIKQGIVRSRRFGTRLAVLTVDVATVGVVASTIGHAAGEKLVQLTAARLKDVLRSTDTVASQAGENAAFSVSRIREGEFVVLLSDMKAAEATTWVVRRVLGALRQPAVIEGNEIRLTAHVGVSLCPDDGEDPDALLTYASTALREAKQSELRHECLYYSRDMNQQSEAQLRLEALLHHALERGELFLEYQPGVDMRSGRIVTLEALVRWRNAELGLVRPDVFIPIAEHSGLIDEMGEWVLRTACRQLRIWHESGFERLSMAVNFSAVQFRRPDLVERVVAVVQEEGIAPDSLVMEITESVLMQNMETAVELADRLAQAGLRIALDDFGTGYSSLTYLQRFPIKVVKIDRSFLHDFPSHAHDAAIVSAIVAMAHGLGLRVVAEGVEKESQLRTLRNLNCDEIQGYLFSRPITREQVTDLLGSPADIRRMVMAAGRFDAPEAAVAGVLNQPPLRSSAG